MSSPPLAHRRIEAGRSATWPPSKPIRRVGTFDGEHLHKSHSAPSTMPVPFADKPAHDPFEDELNNHPEDHFLSPASMYEYEDWADDSDSDADEIEWSAGITDFALFDNDRRRAAEQHENVSGRWEHLLSSQASALQRAVERNRAEADSQNRSWTPLLEDDIPQLTPDNSPDLRDSSHMQTYCSPKTARSAVPHYLTIKVTPPDDEEDEYDDDEDDSEDDELPISVLIQRARERRQAALKKERPGLRFTRTMSGKNHSWRRPGRQIYSVGEDPEAEKKAELLYIECSEEAYDQRGRRQ